MNGNLKVLIHQGEIEQIRHYIKQREKNNTRYTYGDLYGLWRHSFQPVIQFVSVPASASYNDECRHHFNQILYSKHSLRRIGIWTSEDNNYEEMTSQKIQRTIDWEWEKVWDPSYFLIMLVRSPRESLNVTFYLWNMSEPRSYPEVREIDSDHSADVLPGNSSFRIYEPLIKELQKKNGGISIKAREFEVKAAGEVMKVSTEQWYSTERGLEILRKLNEAIYRRFPDAGMSSDPTTNNIGFTLVRHGKEYLLEFPCNFPDASPYVKPPNSAQINIKLSQNPKSHDQIITEVIQNTDEIIQSLINSEQESVRQRSQAGQTRRGGPQQGRTQTQAGQTHYGGSQQGRTQTQAGQTHYGGSQQGRTQTQAGQTHYGGSQQGRTQTQAGQTHYGGSQQGGTQTQAGQTHYGGTQQGGTQTQADQTHYGGSQQGGTQTQAGQTHYGGSQQGGTQTQADQTHRGGAQQGIEPQSGQIHQSPATQVHYDGVQQDGVQAQAGQEQHPDSTSRNIQYNSA